MLNVISTSGTSKSCWRTGLTQDNPPDTTTQRRSTPAGPGPGPGRPTLEQSTGTHGRSIPHHFTSLHVTPRDATHAHSTHTQAPMCGEKERNSRRLNLHSYLRRAGKCLPLAPAPPPPPKGLDKPLCAARYPRSICTPTGSPTLLRTRQALYKCTTKAIASRALRPLNRWSSGSLQSVCCIRTNGRAVPCCVV